MLIVCAAVMSACGGTERDVVPQASASAAPAKAATPVEARPRVVVLGDSLTAGLGLPETEAFPAVLQRKMDAAGYKFEVVNAGVSGDTSAGGMRRLDWALEGDVKVLVLALGANDGLRGLPVDQLKRNLEQIIANAKKRQITVVLAGMEAPPNYGPEYTSGFRNVYSSLAREQGLVLIPFLLDRVAGVSALNQGDGIHPNRQGAEILADTVWRSLRPVLDKISTS